MAFFDKTVGGVTFHCSTLLEELGVPHGFTTRYGGVSTGVFSSLNLGVDRGDEPCRVRENYHRVCTALGVKREGLVFTRQIHKAAVRPVGKEDWGKGLDRERDYEADGLATDIPGTTLTAFGSDCLTVLLFDPVKKAVANVHAGWRGTALGVVEQAVKTLTTIYNSNAADIVAVIGPGISRCCFETREDVPQAMEKAFGKEVDTFVDKLDNEKYKVDLKGLNALQLNRCGVLTTKIDISPDCTMCLHEKYWSHRYTHGERGSQAAFISLPEGRP